MMKKLLIIVVSLLVSAASMSALNIRYRGFADFNGGAFIPSESFNTGSLFGTSTTHGVQLIDGLFVGGGLAIDGVSYSYTDYYGDDEVEVSAAIALYAAGRYEFLHNRKVSPYVDMRLGGGVLKDSGTCYFSPSAGVTVNFTKRFGLDAGLAYTLWAGGLIEGAGDCKEFNGVSIRVGIHF